MFLGKKPSCFRRGFTTLANRKNYDQELTLAIVVEANINFAIAMKCPRLSTCYRCYVQGGFQSATDLFKKKIPPGEVGHFDACRSSPVDADDTPNELANQYSRRIQVRQAIDCNRGDIREDTGGTTRSAPDKTSLRRTVLPRCSCFHHIGRRASASAAQEAAWLEAVQVD